MTAEIASITRFLSWMRTSIDRCWPGLGMAMMPVMFSQKQYNGGKLNLIKSIWQQKVSAMVQRTDYSPNKSECVPVRASSSSTSVTL